MMTRSKAEIYKPKLPYVGVVQQSQVHETVPNSVEAAINNSVWRKAMREEFNALTKNKTWALVPYQNQKLVDDMWIF